MSKERAEFDRLIKELEGDAFERGWRAAVRALTEAAEDLRERPPPGEETAPPKGKRVPKGLVPKTVKAVLGEKGPMRYSNLVRAVLEKEKDIAPPSVRSALKNLRLQGEVDLDDLQHEWFLIGSLDDEIPF